MKQIYGYTFAFTIHIHISSGTKNTQSVCVCVCVCVFVCVSSLAFALSDMTDHHVIWSSSKLCGSSDQGFFDDLLTGQHHRRTWTKVQAVDRTIALC